MKTKEREIAVKWFHTKSIRAKQLLTEKYFRHLVGNNYECLTGSQIETMCKKEVNHINDASFGIESEEPATPKINLKLVYNALLNNNGHLLTLDEKEEIEMFTYKLATSSTFAHLVHKTFKQFKQEEK